MLNIIAALILSATSLHTNNLPKDPYSDSFMECVNNGGQVYSLSDGSLVCEQHR